MKRYSLTTVFWKEGRQYVSKCPELGVASCDTTPAKAQAALAESVELYLANAKKLGILKDINQALNSDSRFTARLYVSAI